MSEQPVPFVAKVRPFLYGLLLGGLAGGVGAGYLWFDMNGQLGEAREQVAAANASAATASKDLQAELDKVQATASIQRARIALDQAQLELGRQNYGLASSKLESAGKLLSGVDGAKAGVEPDKLAEVAARVKAATLNPTRDAISQNELVLELELLVDTLLED